MTRRRACMKLLDGLPHPQRVLPLAIGSVVVATLAFTITPARPVLAAEPANAIVDSPGCHDNTLAANDDGSTGAVPLGFTINFYGVLYTDTFVNNNGNVSFDQAQAQFTPDALTTPGHFPTLAPYFADVDTRGSGSGLVQYGQTTFDGQPAFCVLWPLVGYFNSHTDQLNDFQLLIVSRPDTGAGNFDFYFNYNQIQWETGDASGGSGGHGGECAHVGYTNGSGDPGTNDEEPGSGTCGALIDSNPTGLTHRSRNSTVPGRLCFAVRNGEVLAAVPEVPLGSLVPLTGAVIAGDLLRRRRRIARQNRRYASSAQAVPRSE
jgi:Nidogen-like